MCPLIHERRRCGFLRARRGSAFESLLGPRAARSARAGAVAMERLSPVGVVRAAVSNIPFHGSTSSNSSYKSITQPRVRTSPRTKILGCIERSKPISCVRPLLRERRGCGFFRGRRGSACASLLGSRAARRARAGGFALGRPFPFRVGVVRAARRSGGGACEIDLVSEV